jgi:two-component system, OmpR family, sensor histidine kinase TctE
MSNLVDNAIRYRSRNGGIAVGKAPGFDGCCLCDGAIDRDPDIPAAGTVLVPERFGRSRLTRNQDGDGVGLDSYWRLRAGLSQALRLFLASMLLIWSPSAAAGQDGTFPVPMVEQERLRIAAATDQEVIKPLIVGFQQLHPEIAIDYVEMNTIEVYDAVLSENRDRYPDLVISSAADLQVKLVNDGYSQPHISSATRALPDWANWRDEVFGFTFEPGVIVYNRTLVPETEVPRSRDDIIRLLRGNMKRFHRRVATYDISASGIGYLFATQDSVMFSQFWQLVATLGNAQARLAGNTEDMLNMIERGEVLIAYNALGSYAQARVMTGAPIGIVLPEDYTLVMSRTAMIPRRSPQPHLAGRFIDYLLSREGQEAIATRSTLYAISPEITSKASASAVRAEAVGPLVPIALSPSLMVFLDALKRQQFLRQWQMAFQIP